MTLTPAYGRDYKSAKAVKEAWNADKDFVIADLFSAQSGSYVNRQDLISDPSAPKQVMIRYNKLRSVVSVNVT